MRPAPAMRRIEVSPEMLSFIGAGSVGDAEWPADAVAFVIRFGTEVPAATCHYLAAPTRARLDAEAAGNRLVFIVARAACERLYEGPLPLADGDAFHLPVPLRTIGLTIRDCVAAEALRTAYCLAKSIELLCETIHLVAQERLVPVSPDGRLSMADSERLMAARRLIDERWPEKLTLDAIARGLRAQPGEADARLSRIVRLHRRRCDRQRAAGPCAPDADGDRSAGFVDRLSMRLSEQCELHARLHPPFRAAALAISRRAAGRLGS